MKFSLTTALAVVLLTLASLSVRATPLDDRIAELKHAVEKEAAARANGPNNPNGFVNPGLNPAFIDASIDQIVAQMENPAYGNMDAQLAQITSMYTSTEVQEATTNLLNEIKTERKAKAAAEIADVKALLTARRPGHHPGEEARGPRQPDRGDGQAREQQRKSELQGDPELSRQFSMGYEFVKQWQNYLAHMASGQTDQARNDLQNLSNNNAGDSLLPRSKLLELEAPDKLLARSGTTTPTTSAPALQAQAILDGLRTLDDLKPALAKLEPLRQSDASELQGIYGQLSEMRESYEDIKAGLPTHVNITYNYNNNVGSFSVPPILRRQMLMLTLYARFDSFRGPAPGPEEKPADFVNRVIADATTRQDWELLRRAATARASLTPDMGSGYLTPYASGFESIIAAAHQEAAGQFTLAVQSYETALRSDDPAIPAKIIGDKLAAIQRDHPKEFAEGMQLTVTPPAPRYYPGRGAGAVLLAAGHDQHTDVRGQSSRAAGEVTP